MYVFAVSLELREEWDLLHKGSRVVERIDDKTIVCQFEFRYLISISITNPIIHSLIINAVGYPDSPILIVLHHIFLFRFY